MSKESSLKIIKDFTKKLGKDFSINEVIFFGSRAEGAGNKDSDIDLIIVSDDFKEMNFFERVSSMYNYWIELIPVDFLCYTTEEFARLKKRISIVSEALKKGVVVK
ncbi:nucleotidyltransferase domain-containing protein [Candidatus Pacearchaeota archaeon]|nr:nucleotidyltransferase domain-containing protein [Candidatus Pacearchaeota archaeon]